MSVYQVSVIFEAANDEIATAVAEKISAGLSKVSDQGIIASPKIAFTKYEPEVSGDEKEATDVASE